MMRLLILSDHWGELGGGEVVAAQLARALRDRFEVAVLTTDRKKTLLEQHDGLSLYRVRSNYPARLRPVVGLANPLLVKDVGRVLSHFKPQVVHAWNVHQHLSYASLGLARRSGAATVLTFQDALPFCYTKYHCYIDRIAACPSRPHYRAMPATCSSCWRHYWLFPPRNRLIRELIERNVSQKVSVSQALADALSDNHLPGATVIHNGLPLDDFPAPAAAVAEVRARFGLADEAVVSGGRMGFFKGQHVLLEAFARLASSRPRAQLVLAGRNDDWFGNLLRQRAAELGVAERVVFTGLLPRQQFLALLAAGAVFANLSLYLDPFPTVNLEAGAAHLPVIGTCFGGTPEVVLDGHTGTIINPHDLEQVAEALEGLLSDPDRRAQLGRDAAERIRAKFPVSTMASSYARLFHSLAGGGK